MGERKEAAAPGVAYEGGGSGGSGSSSCKCAAAVCKISKRSQQGIFKKMKPIATYFATPPSNESQAPVHVHVPEPDANILSTEASDANIVEDLVPEHEVYNEGSHDNTLQTSILGFSPTHIEPDPGLRKQIGDYPTPGIRDAVRREYLKKGPCHPYGHDFPCNTTDKRVFRKEWFDEFDWLEYSVKENKAYCFYCYLFKQPVSNVKFGGNVFNQDGYKNWKKAMEYFRLHEGSTKSAHNNARRHCTDFKNRKQSVAYAMTTQTERSHLEYQDCLMAIMGVVRYLLRQGLAFRGHDESKTSRNKGIFHELLDWYAIRCKATADVLNDNAPGNHQMTCHEIQKQMVQACAEKTTEVIMNELGHSHFSLLVDESRDASVREQMAIIIRSVLLVKERMHYYKSIMKRLCGN
ncbi:uncharacterized protein [Triticum aestivum]|uniref:uncharacterized protein isoform X2 n=1 Tax=Triticum aestivum TaxID=4565 RepID=UPI001D00F48A|nr:uncharacterized protein LOC123157382 isoform X2 [Triticum aestivum]